MGVNQQQAVAGTERHLRVAFIWNGTLQAEETLEEPRPVILGTGADALYALPDTLPVETMTVLEPSGTGYRLKMDSQLGGDVWVQGERRDVRELGIDQQLGPDDYGVVTIGPVALFFQHVRAAKKIPRVLMPIDPSVLASIGLSLFLHTALMILLFVAAREFPVDNSLELPADLIAKFMVTPPPEDILEEMRNSGTDMDDPGFQRDEDTGGKRHEGEEGRVGNENAEQEDTEIAGEITGEVAVKVRNMGVLGALQGDTTAAILDVPDLQDVLGGLGAVETIAGRGSGGSSLRGTGRGGGGDGTGSLFGAGGVGTGIGAGRGGLGRGKGGIGVKGKKRGERIVSLRRGSPRVSGYLSAEQINRVVRANQAAIRYCYETEVQRQPNLRGRIAIQWRINLQGSVTTARVAQSTMRNARVEGCMVRQIRRWRFPHPDGGEVVVTYPFIFGIQGG